MQIPYNEIRFEPTSGLDDVGKLFRWNSEVYRGIFNGYVDFYKEIFSSSLGIDLVNLGLVQTELTSHRIDGFDLILQHKRIPVISYASEWTSAMLKDAALMMCDLQGRLLEAGLTLKDGHAQNVLFDACTPTFVDVGSISKFSPNKFNIFMEGFRCGFVYSLLLRYAGFTDLDNVIRLGYVGIARKLPTLRILTYRMLLGRLPLREWYRHRIMDRKISRIYYQDPIHAIKLLREQIISVPVTYSQPSNDPGNQTLDFGNSNKKLEAVDKILSQLHPKSVLIIDSSGDYFPEMSESKGARVICVNLDEIYLDKVYQAAKVKNLNILPLRLDICSPTLAHGPWGICRAAIERLKSEMVLLLDSVPYLVQDRYRTSEDIAFYLFSFSEKWVLVEYVNPQYKHTNSEDDPQNTEFNFDNFQLALRQYFHEVSIECQLDKDRWLVLCAR